MYLAVRAKHKKNKKKAHKKIDLAIASAVLASICMSLSIGPASLEDCEDNTVEIVTVKKSD